MSDKSIKKVNIKIIIAILLVLVVASVGVLLYIIIKTKE